MRVDDRARQAAVATGATEEAADVRQPTAGGVIVRSFVRSLASPQPFYSHHHNYAP